ncbi:MAG: hypothetical protein Q9220_005635 [cf. Caloplaca sp. 1 TL-2023]
MTSTTSSPTITSSTTDTSSSSISTTSSTTTSTACATTPIVQNGDFETGSLAPWTIASIFPAENYGYYSYSVTKPGDNSVYAFTVVDEAADSYFNLQLAQTLTVCPGQKYNLAARYYMTDAYDGPQTFVIVSVDGKQIAMSKFTDAHTPPQYVGLSGSFTASSSGTASLTVAFTATDYLSVSWGLDNVAVTAA